LQRQRIHVGIGVLAETAGCQQRKKEEVSQAH